jgi:hypothetical protein
VTGVARETAVSVAIRPIGSGGNPGPRATATLAQVPPPARVGHVTISSTRGGPLVRWQPARGAARYLASVTINGRTFASVVRSTSLRLEPVASGTRVVIQLRAMSATGTLGPTRSIAYRVPRPRR